MSTTISMWLGIAFVLSGIVATILQAWLWSFPMEPDPDGPDPNGKSTAPKIWTHTHRFLGLGFVVIYVVLMIEMVPRLWEYQVELPARTVIHACMGIVVGVLLVTKISIIRWFQHFGTSLPTLGLMILMCTLILGTLSIPYALKAHDFGNVTTPENLDRVRKVLKNVAFAETVDRVELLDDESMAHGRTVLVEKCVACHDIRKVLTRPKTGNGWLKTVLRMQRLPAMGSIRILDEDVAPVTAYLVAINPSIQEKRKAEKEVRKQSVKAVKEARKGLAAVDQPKGKDAQKAPAFDDEAATELVETKCTECHEMDDIENFGGADKAGWGEIIVQMVDEGGEFTADEVKMILEWLVRHHGPEEGAKAEGGP